MYEEQKVAAAYYQGPMVARGLDENPTVEENLDRRIRMLESELQRLKDSKESLGPLLHMRIRDIRQAMDY